MNNKTKFLSLCLALAVALTAVAPVFSVDAKPQPASGNRININTADAGQLDKLPRVGAKMAERIIEFRKTNGAFKRAEDLMKVKGIGPKIFALLQPLITI